MTTPDDLLAEAERGIRETIEKAVANLPALGTPLGADPESLARAVLVLREENRRLSLALAEEQARSANLRASLEAVREALGDAAGCTGTLAEDVAALVNVVESVRGLPGMFRTGAETSARNAAASGAQANRVKWGKAQEVWGRAADELERALLAGRKEGQRRVGCDGRHPNGLPCDYPTPCDHCANVDSQQEESPLVREPAPFVDTLCICPTAETEPPCPRHGRKEG